MDVMLELSNNKKMLTGDWPECRWLEDMGDAGVGVGPVAGVGRHLLPQEGGQVLVHDDRLQRGDHPPPRYVDM